MRTAILADTGAGRIVTPRSGASDAAVVELHGEIDLELVESLREAVVSRVERGIDVLVDLADVSLIDCASLGVLVQADWFAGRCGHRVCLVAPPNQIRRTLAAAGLDTAFLMFHDRHQAIRGLSSPRIAA